MMISETTGRLGFGDRSIKQQSFSKLAFQNALFAKEKGEQNNIKINITNITTTEVQYIERLFYYNYMGKE